MIWVDREVKKIKKRLLPLEWVDDMKTPSGRIHVGSLRGVIIHDLIYKVLKENGVKAKYTYVFDDHDPMDAIPSYLDFSKWEKYAGMQLYQIPSPEKGYKNFADCYAQEFIEVFNSINCYPKIIWASELYLSGKMNGVIKEVLDGAEKIRQIYYQVTKKPRPADWYPFNVRCEKCQKISTTYVYKWDGRYVYYRCLPSYVAWAKGCGYEGKVSPFNGNGKIPWKVEWAAKWKVIGVTIEGAGKDHMSKGGSHDIASYVAKEVLDYPVPYPISYEWFTVGGRKMSSSKGIGSSAKEISEILPCDVFRFFLVRTPIETHIDFSPYGDTILNIFDDYDRCLNAYFDKLEGKIPSGKKGEVMLDFARIIELSKVNFLPKKRIFLPRFRVIVNLLKIKKEIKKFFEQQKGEKLTAQEEKILEERVFYAKNYLKKYAEIEEEKSSFFLTNSQRLFLEQVVKELKKTKRFEKEEIQKTIFSIIKTHQFTPKEVFPALYYALINQSSGPRVKDLIKEIGLKESIKKIEKFLTTPTPLSPAA